MVPTISVIRERLTAQCPHVDLINPDLARNQASRSTNKFTDPNSNWPTLKYLVNNVTPYAKCFLKSPHVGLHRTHVRNVKQYVQMQA